MCPLLIPFLITFDVDTEMTNEVSPSDCKKTGEEDSKRASVRCSIGQRIRNVVSFYNAAIVKFCSHSVRTILTPTALDS